MAGEGTAAQDEREVADQVLREEDDDFERDAAAARSRLEVIRTMYEEKMTNPNPLLPPNMRSLKGRVSHYGHRANLQLEEIVDCGRTGPNNSQRFTIKEDLARPLSETVRKMQIVLSSLRSAWANDKSTYVVDGGQFLKILDCAPSLEELQLAWVGITNRLLNAQAVYRKYWAEAMRALGAQDVEVLSQPASTPSTIYRQIDREEDPSRRLRLALGGLPSSRAAALNVDRQRDVRRFLTQPLDELIKVDSPIREAFPPREEEENPLLLFFDDEGRRHLLPPNTTAGNPLGFNPAPPPAEQAGPSVGPGTVEFELLQQAGQDSASAHLQKKKKKKKKAKVSAFGLLGSRRDDDEEEDEDDGDDPDPRGEGAGTSSGRGGGRGAGGGGGGDPYGAPPGSRDGQGGQPYNPYGTQMPTVNPVIKPSELPQWDGNRDKAIMYFSTIVELARNGGYLPRALGEWLWTRLVPFSEIHQWFLAQSEERRDHMRLSYRHYIDTIREEYLGEDWVEDLDTKFKLQRFRESKHARESPSEYILRRVLLARIMGYAEENSLAEARMLINSAPRGWKLVVSFSSVKSTDELVSRIKNCSRELIEVWRRNRDLADDGDRGVSRAGWKPAPSTSARTAQVMEAEWEADSASEDDAEAAEQRDSRNGGDDLLAVAYAAAKKRVTAHSGRPLFPPRNEVRSKGSKPPPGPCFACGSLNHWNKDCPHWDEYQSRQGLRAEQEERATQIAYDTAYSLIAQQGFEGAAQPTSREGGECKTHETTRREVLLSETTPFVNRIEEIQEDYWHNGECLPVDSLYDLEYIYASAEEGESLRDRGVRAEVNRIEETREEANSESEGEGAETESDWPRPYEPDVLKLKPRPKKRWAKGEGISVLNVRGRLGSREDQERDCRYDTGANVTLVSENCHRSLRNPPPIKQGEPMKLLQLTDVAPAQGTVRMGVFMEADDGTPIEVEADAYVVPGMTVDVLLGEDFMQAYGISVRRSFEGGESRTEIVFEGAPDHPITAVGVRRSKDYDEFAKSYVGEIPAPRFARRGQFKRIRQHRRKKREQARLVDSLVRVADERVRLPPHACVRVRVEGPFEDGEDWVVEKLLLTASQEQFLAVPNTIVTAEHAYVPVANPSDTPRVLRRGEVLGRAHRAQDYFRTPRSEEELERLTQHADQVTKICELRQHLQPGSQSPKATPMPDAAHYEEWKGRPPPARDKFHMP